MDAPRTFHLHMISDATGETLVAVAKAVRVQYSQVRAIEHIHPLVRSKRELERVLKSGDLLLTMGAGDVVRLGEAYLAGTSDG